MKVFLISSEREVKRAANILKLKAIFCNIQNIEAIYPAFQKIPFKDKLITKANKSIHRDLKLGELGCILSHRKAWLQIKNDSNPDTAYLILESDAIVNDLGILNENFEQINQKFDIVFWGAFDGRTKLLKSKKYKLDGKYYFGQPLLNSLYCTYGYSLNKEAANYLLDNTKSLDLPVDYWKCRLKNSKLRIGAIVPELISTEGLQNSYIHTNKSKSVTRLFFDTVIDIKNSILSFFR